MRAVSARWMRPRRPHWHPIEQARERLHGSAESFRALARNRNLVRLELAWAGSIIGTWAYGVAMAVYAFGVGGAAAVGLAGLIRFAPMAIFGAFIGGLGDRFERRRVMVASDLLRAGLFVGGAVAIAGGAPRGVIFTIGAVLMLCAAPFRPAQAGLVPKLTDNAEELTAANVVSTTIESVGFFAGPALASAILAIGSPQAVFVMSSLTCIWSALLVVRIRLTEDDEERGEAPSISILRAPYDGLKAVLKERDLRVMVGLFTVQTVVCGALNVLTVVLALEVLGTGASGVGLLTASVGVGGVLGAVAAAAIGRRLAGGFMIGIVLWGAPLMVIGLWPSTVTAVLMLALVGVGNTVVDVAGFTLLQRCIPDAVMSRVFALVETVLISSIGLGAIITPPIVNALGEEGAFVAIGSVLPILTVLLYRRLSTLDEIGEPPADALALVRGVSFFKPLPLLAQERLAVHARHVAVPLGTEVFHQGDRGDRFYVVARGAFDVVDEDMRVARLEAGAPFGEIALLHDVPRTATVMAAKPDSEVLVFDREEFIATVTGYDSSATAAEDMIGARVAHTGTQRMAFG